MGKGSLFPTSLAKLTSCLFDDIHSNRSNVILPCDLYSAYKFNKQGDNIQPWHTPFPILLFHDFCNFIVVWIHLEVWIHYLAALVEAALTLPSVFSVVDSGWRLCLYSGICVLQMRRFAIHTQPELPGWPLHHLDVFSLGNRYCRTCCCMPNC